MSKLHGAAKQQDKLRRRRELKFLTVRSRMAGWPTRQIEAWVNHWKGAGDYARSEQIMERWSRLLEQETTKWSEQP